MPEHPLRAWCLGQGWTQRRLAAALGVTPGTISHLLSGRTLPSLALAGRIRALTGGAVRVEVVWSGSDGEWRTALGGA